MATCPECAADDLPGSIASCPRCGASMSKRATSGSGGRWVELWTASAALTSKVDEALDGIAPKRPTFGRREGTQRGYVIHKPTGPRDLPPVAAFVVTTGTARTADRFATSLGAMALVLPEAGEYLLTRARRAIADRTPLVLVGFDVRPK